MENVATGTDILHADASLLVAVKPAGMLAVPGRGADKHDCLASRVQACFDDALVVHRLDMATSGLMLLARGPQVQRRLSMAFARREVHKRYVAVVAGRLAAQGGDAADGWSTIELPLLVDWPKRPLQKVDAKQGKPSTTRYRVLAHDEATDSTRVELEPVTGRTHQLRVHLQALGHPILGDALYAPVPLQARASRLLLHATALHLQHPVSGQALHFESAAPF